MEEERKEERKEEKRRALDESSGVSIDPDLERVLQQAVAGTELVHKSGGVRGAEEVLENTQAAVGANGGDVTIRDVMEVLVRLERKMQDQHQHCQQQQHTPVPVVAAASPAVLPLADHEKVVAELQLELKTTRMRLRDAESENALLKERLDRLRDLMRDNVDFFLGNPSLLETLKQHLVNHEEPDAMGLLADCGLDLP